jgi:hypothetical protein
MIRVDPDEMKDLDVTALKEDEAVLMQDYTTPKPRRRALKNTPIGGSQVQEEGLSPHLLWTVYTEFIRDQRTRALVRHALPQGAIGGENRPTEFVRPTNPQAVFALEAPLLLVRETRRHFTTAHMKNPAR